MVDTIYVTPTRAIFNGGQFDTNFRYLRRVSSGARVTMVAGPSFAIAGNTQYWMFSFRFQVGACVVLGVSDTGLDGPVPAPTSVPNSPRSVTL